MATKKKHTNAKTSKRRTDAAPVSVTPEKIRSRAYEIYEARSGSGRPGDAVGDWIAAEQELSDRPSREAVTAGSGSPGASAAVEVRARHAITRQGSSASSRG